MEFGAGGEEPETGRLLPGEEETGGRQGAPSAAEAGEVGGWVGGSTGWSRRRWEMGGEMGRTPGVGHANVLTLEVEVTGLTSTQGRARQRAGRTALRPPSGDLKLLLEPGPLWRLPAGRPTLTPRSGRVWKEPGGWLCLCPPLPAPPPTPLGLDRGPLALQDSASLFAFLPTDYSSGQGGLFTEPCFVKEELI